MVERKFKWVLSSGGAFDFSVSGIYDTQEQLLEQLRKDWGIGDELTVDEMMTHRWQSDAEIKIEKAEYFQSKTELRDEKIQEVLK